MIYAWRTNGHCWPRTAPFDALNMQGRFESQAGRVARLVAVSEHIRLEQETGERETGLRHDDFEEDAGWNSSISEMY